MKRITTLFGALILPIAAQAQWSLVDDFNDQDVSNITLKTISATAELWIGPEDTEDTALYLESGDYGAGWGDSWASISLPGSIGPGETGTLFWRAFQYGTSNNWHVSLTDVPQSASWGDHASITRAATGGELGVRNGASYIGLDPEFRPEMMEWYSYWTVVDYDAKTFKLYVQGPDDAAPVQLFGEGPNPIEDIAFRGIPTNPLAYVVISSNTDNPSQPNLGDLFFIDDIYFADGVYLTDPRTAEQPEDSYGPFPVTEDYAHVPSLGWVYVAQDPWILSLAYNTWIYSANPAPDENAGGIWAYVTNETPASQDNAIWAGYADAGSSYLDTGAWLGWLYAGSAPWIHSSITNTWFFAEDPGAGAAGAWIFFPF